MAVIEFCNVTKTYRRRFAGAKVPALSGISFQVRKGEVCGFLGPNGAGKTTCMNILMGFSYADEGQLSVLDHLPGNVRTKERIGFLPENFAFYQHLDAEELLHFHLRLSGRRAQNSGLLIADLIARVKLDSYSGLKIGKYSRGMVQRVGIAQALLGAPDLLVLDEPTSGLDPAGRKDLRDLILALKAEGKTIFLSSHILSEIEQMCDQAIIVSHGRLLRAGPIQEMLAKSDRVEIKVDQLPETLERAMKDRGASVNREGDHVCIFSDIARKHELLEMLWSNSCDLISITPIRDSLEEMFLKLVGDKE